MQSIAEAIRNGQTSFEIFNNIINVNSAAAYEYEAFQAFMENEGLGESEAADSFEESYAGTFPALEAWAEDFANETGMLAEMPENLRYYFDFEAYARDCWLNGDIWIVDVTGGVAVFWNR